MAPNPTDLILRAARSAAPQDEVVGSYEPFRFLTPEPSRIAPGGASPACQDFLKNNIPRPGPLGKTLSIFFSAPAPTGAFAAPSGARSNLHGVT